MWWCHSSMWECIAVVVSGYLGWLRCSDSGWCSLSHARMIEWLIGGSFALKGSMIFPVISGSDRHTDGAGLSLQSLAAISLLIMQCLGQSALSSVCICLCCKTKFYSWKNTCHRDAEDFSVLTNVDFIIQLNKLIVCSLIVLLWGKCLTLTKWSLLV